MGHLRDSSFAAKNKSTFTLYIAFTSVATILEQRRRPHTARARPQIEQLSSCSTRTLASLSRSATARHAAAPLSPAKKPGEHAAHACPPSALSAAPSAHSLQAMAPDWP